MRFNYEKNYCYDAVLCIFFSIGTTVFAAEEPPTMNDIPIIDDSVDFSLKRIPTYTYEGDYVIESYEASAEEIEMGQKLQELHSHLEENGTISPFHFSLTPHSHSIRNVKNGSPKYYVWRPTKIWTRNSLYPNSSDWPTVSWTTSKSCTVSKSVNTSVGVTDSVVSASIGSNFTTNHTISTSTTRTFKVPYRKDGRVKVNFYRPYKTFTCVTTYVFAGPPLRQWEETGSGNAEGKPYNIVCDLETKNY